MIGKRPTEIVVWDFPVLNGKLDVCEVISSYLSLRRVMQINISRFFLRNRPEAT